MNNYKRSLLSLATILALSTVTVNANYIPLTDIAGSEEQWSLFGVSGLKTDGAGAGSSAGEFSITSSTANATTDAVLDELFVEGFLSGTDSLAKVKVLSPYTTLEVRIDTTGIVFDEKDPVRTMYITMTDGAGPAFAISYRASLEGLTLEFSTNTDGSDAHETTISSANTYSNPALATVIQDVPGVPGAALSKIADAVDYNFESLLQPADAAYYSKADDQTLASAGEYISVYSYDATNERWDLYDSRNTDDANDFLSLTKGKAYWGKMNAVDNATAGLVLASENVSATEFQDANVTAGWNLASFGSGNPYIRKSSTGLLVTLKALATVDGIKIWDSSGNHFVTANVDGTSLTTASDSCKSINQAIKQSKIEGKMPETFDLKAMVISATQIALISNKRFMIDELAADSIGAVTTLTGANPYTVDPTDMVNTADAAAVDLDFAIITEAALSKYGEYAVVIEPLLGDADNAAPWDTAAATAAGAAKLHIQSVASDATAAAPIAMDNTDVFATALTNTVTAIDGTDIDGSATYQASAYAIDTDYDGAGVVDHILVASTAPFYVRDYTFTRVFKFTDDAIAPQENTITISGTGVSAPYTTVVGDTTATLLAANLTATNNVFATDDNNGNLVIFSSATDANEFTVTENTSSILEVDQLEVATITADVAKGAVKGIYSLDSFALRDVESTSTLEMTSWPSADADTLDVQITNSRGTVDAVLAVTLDTTGVTYVVDTDAEAVLVAAKIQKIIENAISDADMTATVTLTNTPDNAGPTYPIWTVTGTNIKALALDFTGGAADVADLTDAGAIASSTADLTADLKFNAVYSPNYVVKGPLYTMKEAGFTMKAMVTGTTDLTDGSITWESVDLSRKPSEWLDSQDYNLFSVSETSGYWVYLEEDTAGNPLVVANPSLTQNYTYHFDIGGVNYNHISGNVEIEVQGMDEYDNRDSAIVSVNVAGSDIELARSGTSNVYAGKLSSYELSSISTGFEYEVFANIADGLGYNIISQDTTLKVDYNKPATPTIDLGDGTSVTFASASEDVLGYYVFNGQIPEESTSTASNLMAKLTSAEAVGYALCENTDKIAWDGNLYDLNVIAVDGGGILGKGNVSNTVTAKYVPMLKSAVRLEDTNSGASDPTQFGTVFDATCADAGAQTINYDVTLTSETDLETVKMAYEPKNGTGNSTPISLFVNAVAEGGTVIAKITYDVAYVGETVFIELSGIVYSLELPTDTEIAAYAAGTDVANPLDLTDAGTNSAVMTDQSL